jgi:ABC-2 type transport system permease protein
VIFLMQISVCAIVHDNQNVQAFLKFLEVLPSIVKVSLGGDILQAGNTPGLIAIGYQHPFVLFLFLLYAVGAPTLLLSFEVQKGNMELILSRPVTKTQVYVCASILTLAGMFALVQVMFLGTAAGTRLYDFGEPVRLDLFFRIAMNGGLQAGAAGSIALCVAGVWGGRRLAMGVTVAVLVINYFMWVVGQWWPPAGFLLPATLFYYTDGAALFRGWPLDDMAVLAGIILVLTTVGGVVWRRRDLPL